MPWIFRTYAGHSTAAASNALYRKNLSKGQTGLSVAFDLPTQTGYDSDHPLAKGEVGKVGVPISHIGDMRALFDGIPLGEMNTSMTINATAAWLLALYIAVADEQGAPRAALQGTTQNDIIKEYLSRGTYVFPPAPSMRLTKDVILFTTSEMPKWNPMNVCSYHLQEAGATPVQELAFALATAIGVLDAVKEIRRSARRRIRRGGRAHLVLRQCRAALRHRNLQDARLHRTVGRDHARALWRDRSQAAAVPLRRAGQFARAHRAAAGEQRRPHPDRDAGAVTLSKKARARAVQLPAWNEALGLPRPWDQQWSLRMQQILAYETDLLEYGDLFDGSPVIAAKVAELKRGEGGAQAHRGDGRRDRRRRTGYMKQQLVEANSAPRRGDRARRADRGRRQQIRRDRTLAADRRPTPS
jgi:(2R)-ethylmalonyl-CoA mutase